MDCLYDVHQNDGCFFRETLVNRTRPETILYQKDVKRKADPLLIIFMNAFTPQDFDGHSFPAVFSKMLRHFQTHKLVQDAWKNGKLNASFIQQWLSSDDWREGLSETDQTQQFFLGCILEKVLYPVIITAVEDEKKSQAIVQIIMNTDWDHQRVCTRSTLRDPLVPYWARMGSLIDDYGMFWHFIRHQATTAFDGSYGLFPEKKVRFYCLSCLNFSFDSRKQENYEEALNYSMEHRKFAGENPRMKWLRAYLPRMLRRDTDPVGFCLKFDEAYSLYAHRGDSFWAGSLLDILCLSLLHFAIYGVPIRQCSLCQRFYIPVKNQSGDMNYCHRNFKPGSNQTCSGYHSHNQKSILPDKELSSAKALENTVGTIRSTFSQSSIASFPNGRAWLDFLRDVVTIVSRTSRKDAQKIEQCSQILDRVKQLHRIMKEEKCCPEQNAPSLDPKTDDLETADSRLREAIADLLEKKDS